MPVDRSPAKTRSVSTKVDSPMPTTDIIKSLKNIELKFDAFDKKLDNLEKKLNTKFSDISKKVESIEEVLSSQIKAFEIQLQVQNKIFEESTKLTADKFQLVYSNIEILDKSFDGRLNDIQVCMDSRLDFIERRINSVDLIVRGIPDLSSENLYQYFQQMSTAISFPTNENIIESIFRVPTKESRNRKVKSTPIIIRFLSTSLKQAFFGKYFKFKNLNLTHIGFDVTTRIYVNESLTKRNHDIFKQAIKLKSAYQLFNVSTRNGLVCIRKQANGDLITINNIQVIKNLGCQLQSQHSSTTIINES